MTELPWNAGELVEYWHLVAPDREAVRYGERSWTWAQLAARVDANAAVQRAVGLRAGDRVGVLDKNHPAYLETALACLRAGTVMVPVNHLLPVDQARYLISDARVRLLIVGAEFRPVADAIAADIPVIVIGGVSDQYEQWLAQARHAQRFGGVGSTVPRRGPAPRRCIPRARPASPRARWSPAPI
jgi:acyl-CoA synthetase (AMP-forming)/AMP-acid ligase II